MDTSERTAEPIFVIHDATIAEKTKPSSLAVAPMELAGFQHSHLLGKAVWGHQAQATVVGCAGRLSSTTKRRLIPMAPSIRKSTESAT